MCRPPKTLAQRFLGLNLKQQKSVEIDLCQRVLQIWQSYAEEQTHGAQREWQYFDGVVGMLHSVDIHLPARALQSVKGARSSVQKLNPEAELGAELRAELQELSQAYQEPIVALQDQDWELPEPILYAYYAIYNLWRKYVLQQSFETLLIVNQALSSLSSSEDEFLLLETLLEKHINQI